ncbi:hypothetical protein OIU78_016881 [Salix suchowensis]|nr:hypothetical protein OIU78_016881 [Salix suchowensis]
MFGSIMLQEIAPSALLGSSSGPPKPNVEGSNLIWNRWQVPRHAFILWLASRSRLRTLNRCAYSAEVWREVTLRAIINWPALPWERAWEWAAKEFTNRSNPNQNLVGMILAATIYHLWAERNNRLHMQVFCSAKHTTDKTLNAIRDKIASLGPFEEFWAELEALVAALDCGWARFLFISKLGCGWARCLLA